MAWGLTHTAAPRARPAPPSHRVRRGLAGPGRGDGARGGPPEEGAEQELTLAGEPWTARHVIEREQRRGSRPAPRPGRAQRGPEAGRGGDEDAHVERAEREIPGPQRHEQQQVRQVHAGKVHVEDVAIRGCAFQDPPRHVVHERGVVDERPAAGLPEQPKRGERDQHDDDTHDHPESPTSGRAGRRLGQETPPGDERASWARCQDAPDPGGRRGVWRRPCDVSSEVVGRSAEL